MDHGGNPNGSDFTIVTDVLLYSVFATHPTTGVPKGDPFNELVV